MPHLSGVFDQFPDLEKANIDQLLAWMSKKPERHALINFLGNRVLYPQTIPLNQSDLEMDFAILRAAIRLRPSLVFQPQTNKIIIPKIFADRFPPLRTMVLSIIEGINPKGIHFIYLKDGAQLKIIGSVISPLNPQRLSADGKTVVLATGKTRQSLSVNTISVVSLPVSEAKVVLGNEEFKALGGDVGVIIDLRLGGFQ
jgi:hypothetical protein